MKRILFAVAVLALIAPAVPQARAADVSIDFFYNNLSGGNWIEAEGYGYGWQPDIAVSDPNWRPYTDGYWAYSDVGWTWVSYEDFGWATCHYGRWADLADYGWVWFPGSDLEWGPAWVSWRYGGDYVGWAPLPPRGGGIVYEGQPIGGRVDIEFDIGPRYYNFCDVRFIGEPVLRDRILPVSQNVTYIENTVNVTNIMVQNNVVYNYGPDYRTLSAYSTRPIQHLTIERQPATDFSAAARSGALTKVQGNKLVVAAPEKISKAAPGVVPPKVKTKVAQPKIQKGWTGVQNEAQLKQKIQTENPKNIPPPTHSPAPGRAVGGVSPSPEVSASPFERGKGRKKTGALGTPPESAGGLSSAPAAPGATASPFERGKGRGRGKPGGRPEFTPPGPQTGTGSPAIERSPTGIEREHGKPGKGKPGASPTGAPPEQTGAAPLAPEATQPGKHKGRFERGAPGSSPGGPGGPAGGPPVTGAAPGGAQGGKQKGQGAYGQPAGALQGASAETARGHGKAEHGKKKGEETPPPGPQ